MERDIRVEVIDWKTAEILAQKTPEQRIAIANSAHNAACTMIKSVVASLHPDWTEEQRHREFLRRLLGRGADQYLASCG